MVGDGANADPEPVIDVKTLHAKIEDLPLENDLLSGALIKPAWSAHIILRC